MTKMKKKKEMEEDEKLMGSAAWSRAIDRRTAMIMIMMSMTIKL